MTEMSQAQANTSQGQESCRSCLYTGVATCMGLSGYFLYLAYEEDGHPTMKTIKTPEIPRYESTSLRNLSNVGRGDAKSAVVAHGSKSCLKNIKTSLIEFMQGHPVAKRNRPFLFALSAFCAGSGAYRLYLN